MRKRILSLAVCLAMVGNLEALERAADVNKDGRLNLRDVVALRKLIVG